MGGTLPEHYPFKSEKSRDRYLAAYDELAGRWPIPSHTTLVETEHARTFIRISGPEDAPPLILLPAMGVTSYMWMSVIEALAARFRTYAVDDPFGGGRSADRSIPQSVADGPMPWLDELLDALDLDQPVDFMGLSLGGYFVAEYVLHAPSRVAKAVWLAPPATVLPISRDALRGLALMAPLALVPTRASIGRLLRHGMPDLARLKGADRDDFDAQIALSMTAMRCFGKRPWGCGGPRVLQDAELAGIEVPVLYLVGENETFCNAEDAVARLNGVAPRIRTAIVPGAGHDLVWTQPEAVVSRVLEFLDASNEGMADERAG